MSEGEIVVTGQRNYTFTVPENEVLVHVTQREWTRLRNRVDALRKHEAVYFSIAWACVGVAASAGFGALAWAQPYDVLNPAQQLGYVWIWIVLAIAGAAAVALGAGMFVAGAFARRNEKTAAQQIVEDMDDIQPPIVKLA